VTGRHPGPTSGMQRRH